MNEVRNVLKRFPEPYKASISSRCNVKEGAVDGWEKRGVPAKHHGALVAYANELSMPDITYELLQRVSKNHQPNQSP